MKYSREEYIELMTFGEARRPMFVELFGPMVGLEKEWLAQGATPDEIALTAFDWDYVPVVQCGGNTGLFGGKETVTLEETEDTLIQRDALGRTMKLFKNVATIPLPLDFPVRDMDTWLAVKPLFTYHPRRVDAEALRRAREEQAKGSLVVAYIPGGFDIPRELMGEVLTCTGFYEQPELLHDIIQTLKETSLRVLERVTDEIVIDQLSVHEDLAGKSGPLIGPRQFLPTSRMLLVASDLAETFHNLVRPLPCNSLSKVSWLEQYLEGTSTLPIPTLTIQRGVCWITF